MRLCCGVDVGIDHYFWGDYFQLSVFLGCSGDLGEIVVGYEIYG